MLRVRDNPAPVDLGGGLKKYYGPAKNRPAVRIYQLWAYCGIRHRATMSDLWFHLFCQTASALQFCGGFHGLDEAEAERAYSEVIRKHQKRHHPFHPYQELPGDDD